MCTRMHEVSRMSTGAVRNREEQRERRTPLRTPHVTLPCSAYPVSTALWLTTHISDHSSTPITLHHAFRSLGLRIRILLALYRYNDVSRLTRVKIDTGQPPSPLQYDCWPATSCIAL